MARKIQKRVTHARNRAYQPQDLLLAGVGAISLGRKQIFSAYSNGFDNVVDLVDRTQDVVRAVSGSITEQAADYAKKVVSLRKHLEKRVVVLRKQLDARAETLRKQVQAALDPVLAKLAPPRRKLARAKPPAKRSRKAA